MRDLVFLYTLYFRVFLGALSAFLDGWYGTVVGGYRIVEAFKVLFLSYFVLCVAFRFVEFSALNFLLSAFYFLLSIAVIYVLCGI